MASELYLRALRFAGDAAVGSIFRPPGLCSHGVDAVFAAGQRKLPGPTTTVGNIAQDRVALAAMVDPGFHPHTLVAIPA